MGAWRHATRGARQRHQAAHRLDAFLAERPSELVGLASMHGYEIGLAELAGKGGWFDSAVSIRAPEHMTIPVGEDESITCVQFGLPGPAPGIA